MAVVAPALSAARQIKRHTQRAQAIEALCGLLDAMADALVAAGSESWSRFITRGKADGAGPAMGMLRQNVAMPIMLTVAQLIAVVTDATPPMSSSASGCGHPGADLDLPDQPGEHNGGAELDRFRCAAAADHQDRCAGTYRAILGVTGRGGAQQENLDEAVPSWRERQEKRASSMPRVGAAICRGSLPISIRSCWHQVCRAPGCEHRKPAGGSAVARFAERWGGRQVRLHRPQLPRPCRRSKNEDPGRADHLHEGDFGHHGAE